MELQEMYGAVLMLVLIGIILGIGLTILGALASNSALDSTAAAAVNDTLVAIAGFTTWISIIVIVVAAAIIVTLVIRSFRA